MELVSDRDHTFSGFENTEAVKVAVKPRTFSGFEHSNFLEETKKISLLSLSAEILLLLFLYSNFSGNF